MTLDFGGADDVCHEWLQHHGTDGGDPVHRAEDGVLHRALRISVAADVARFNGQLPLRNMNHGADFDGTDMTFDIVKGAPFRWTRLSTTNITGTVHWLGQYLILTNVNAAAYGGHAQGHAFFDFGPTGYGCDFNFALNVMPTLMPKNFHWIYRMRKRTWSRGSCPATWRLPAGREPGAHGTAAVTRNCATDFYGTSRSSDFCRPR